MAFNVGDRVVVGFNCHAQRFDGVGTVVNVEEDFAWRNMGIDCAVLTPDGETCYYSFNELVRVAKEGDTNVQTQV